ncbi:carbamoyltransferase HypF [Lamprobacter modestohalophilus]|uniref:carbamoyltransferase HypF n=1 Tax=Lamprobacter modestohalophilus TaxID=1064514 RepID=UPI002ADECB4B|nr:carbamoyltransferase HypF [Lamprobacter modestohalophilus]MEA1051691.1 carbamoyltransferase HypF [Lamprobacter modestohalophilus]
MSNTQASRQRLRLHTEAEGESIRVRGLVQGVGFRPTVWRLATAAGLAGDVCNDSEGVLIRLWGRSAEIDDFCRALMVECPPLGRIDGIERRLCEGPAPAGFRIIESGAGRVQTGVVADAATCAACAAEIADPNDRRYRYPFTNCTHCGPRLSIIRAIPYDRANTSMAAFEMCPACAAEYRAPADRRFHAQPNACPVCGPKVWLADAEGLELDAAAAEAGLASDPAADLASDPGAGLPPALASHPAAGQAPDPEAVLAPDFAVDLPDARLAVHAPRDAIDGASRLLARGATLAIKGIGGFHLACDATHPSAVATLRERKRRAAKPFALMARDLEVIRRYCAVSPAEAELLSSTVAPIVLLDQVALDGDLDLGLGNLSPLAAEVAPGQSALGLMLPYSPLHQLLLQDWDRPLVMTSGNLSDEPQCIDNADALQRLAGIADAWLLNDREIVNRVDDSVARVIQGRTRWLRRARGAAPTPLRLPSGFELAPKVLALGGELKNSLCLLSDGQATLSQHLGDLEEARTAREFERTVALYQALFEHQPEIIAVDCHPDYRSSALGRRLAAETGARLVEVQHHAAHLGAVLADAEWPLDAGPVIGVIFDGLGYGADQTIWGGEFLLGDYRQWQRVGHLRPFSLPGGERAIREPWRCLYAQLESVFGWPQCLDRWGGLEPIQGLQVRPLTVIEEMIQKGLNSPRTTSAGRLFDAVAAALGICADGIAYEAQAAIELETLALGALGEVGYAFAIDHRDSSDYSGSGDHCDNSDNSDSSDKRWQLDPTPMWTALLDDLTARVPAAVIAARFHAGLAEAVAELAAQAAQQHGVETVALSGGVFQNRTLFEATHKALSERGLQVLTHTRVPANDGGLALGQAVIAAVACSG